jgi:hypothetical protein
MSSPRDPANDLSLERLGDRDRLRPAHLGEFALVAPALAPAHSRAAFQAAREALVDAAFAAPGAAEWLAELRRAVAALLAGKDKAPPHPVPRDAVRQAQPGEGRG